VGTFHRLDPKRLAVDQLCIVGDRREYCTVYRRGAEQGSFWGRIANIGRQTTGLEQWRPAGEFTGMHWVLHAPPNALTLKHNDEIRTSAELDSGTTTRWRVIHRRDLANGQLAILKNIQ